MTAKKRPAKKATTDTHGQGYARRNSRVGINACAQCRQAFPSQHKEAVDRSRHLMDDDDIHATIL